MKIAQDFSISLARVPARAPGRMMRARVRSVNFGAPGNMLAPAAAGRYKPLMRKDIEHLSASDRHYLEGAVGTIRAEFAKAMRRKKKEGANGPRRILKIILYGSMARGHPVRDMKTGYKSDYDLLVIVSDPALTSMRYWEGAADALQLDEGADETRYPTSFIVPDLDDVNNQLYLGRPFFKDIFRDGIIVYEVSKRALAKPGNLTPEEALAEARIYFEQWFPKIESSLKIAKFCFDGTEYNDAAFNLHQACERAYHCALLTLTLYSPKQHNIKFLRGMAEGIEPRLIVAWPRKTYYERRPFNRLVRAYVEARYSPSFVITLEDLTAAAEHVAKLQAIVKQVCEERLARTVGP